MERSKTMILLLVAALVSIGVANPAEVPHDLQTVPVANALGLELDDVAFEWTSSNDDAKALRFQILVASDLRKLDAEVGDLWDTGWRNQGTSSGVLYRGRAFAPGSEVWWKVRVRHGDEGPGLFSEPAAIQVLTVPRVKQPGNDATNPTPLVRNRVVFIGSTLISRMAHHGFLETAVTIRWPHHDITFRNLGWPGDDVYGTARSEFGSAYNTRSWVPPERQEGFGYDVLMKQVEDEEPTTLIIGYGTATAFAVDAEAFERFTVGYQNLITVLEKTGAKIILLSPPRQEGRTPSEPPPVERNRRLRRTADFIGELARERQHGFVDLYRQLVPEEAGVRLTENGIHLSELGYRQMATLLARAFGVATYLRFDVEFSNTGELTQLRGATFGDPVKTKHGVRFDLQSDSLPALHRNPSAGRVFVKGAVEPHRLKIDGLDVIEAAGKNWDDGVRVGGGPDFEQAEALRQTIIEKNRLHRYRIRPMNKAYIFLFRRHEMGHLAYELEEFDRLVEEKEELIARLRVPVSHRYELEQIEPWKPPRKYPDHEVPLKIPTPDLEAELKAFTVAEGFQINLFAANPMIYNPINLNWDARGRAWVSTSSTYPHIKPGREPNDRIVILEDRDGDGQADWSTVFAEGLLVPHSVMPVEGGAYVCSTTELLFLADRDGDDSADDRRVVFSGFGNADVHHMIHGLRWAPWGDLFLTQSIYINSFVETPYGTRQLNGSGIWRFRPETEQLDVFVRGMVNPWGHAFDRWGQAFGTDGAGGSGPHYAFPGAAFQTAVGAGRVLAGLIPGKPKNTAAEFVSGRHMPEAWQGSLLANDYRANRTVRYELTESGSGFSAKEVETVLHSSHRSYRPVDIKMGPEGAIYIVDWYNPIIDHGEVDFHHPLRDRSHGRIWRLTAKGRPFVKRPNIRDTPVEALLDHLKSPEEFTRLQANRELARWGAAAVVEKLRNWVARLDPADPEFEHHRLEALWLHGALRSPNRQLLETVLKSPDHRSRAAAVRMVNLGFQDDPSALQYLARAVEDEHPRVRLEAVNTLRERDTLEAADIALRALGHPLDANLDYALWLTARELRSRWLPALQSGQAIFGGNSEHLSFALNAAGDRRALEPLVALVRSGRIASANLENAVRVIGVFGGTDELALAVDMARKEPGLLPALVNGARANPTIPANAESIRSLMDSNTPAIRVAAIVLAGRWKIESANPRLAELAGKETIDSETRFAAAEGLARQGDFGTLGSLAGSENAHPIRIAAIAAWAGQKAAEAVESAVTLLTALTQAEEAAPIFNAFIQREDGARLLAGALANSKVESTVAAQGIRLAQSSGRDLSILVSALTRAGSLSPVSREMNADQRRTLLESVRVSGNATRGRQIYQGPTTACTACHRVEGVGGKLGPDLTTLGTYMTPEVILESLLNPNTDIKQGYETVVVNRKDGTVVSGTLQRKSDTGVLVRDATEAIISIPGEQIEELDVSPISMMPPGLTDPLRKDELVDLLRYLTTLGKEASAVK